MPAIALNMSIRGQLLSGVRFNPSSLFSSSEPGVWFDPSDVANLDWRRNLLTWTEQFDNAAWTKGGVTVTANSAAAPDGTTTAEKVTADTANSFHRLSAPTQNLSATSHTLSVYMKAAEYTSGGLSLFDGSVFTGRATFDLSAGTVAITNGTATITSVGNGWYRCTVTGNGSATTSAFISVNSVFTFTGDGTSGILIWGAQLETGSVATEYQRITDVNTEVRERFPTATLFQDTAGTTPVTTPGQTVALALDKSKGLVLGPELVTNGTFDSGITGWTKGAGTTDPVSWDSVGKRLKVTNDLAYFANANQTLSGLVVGRSYLVTGSISENTVDARITISGMAASSIIVSPGGGIARFVFTATLTSHVLLLQNNQNTLGGVAFFDNISVRELPGFHATQATAASRPTYGVVPATGRRNLLTFTEQFDNAAWVKTGVTAIADKLTASAGVSAKNVQQSGTVASVPNTFAIDAKAGTSQYLQLWNGSFQTLYANFNLQTGVVSAVGSGATASISSTGDGWYRCVITVTPVTNSSFRIAMVSSGTAVFNESWTALGTETVFIRKAQLETGSSATAYQRVVSSFDVTEAGVQSLSYLSFDGVDDFLVTPTITPGIDKVQVFAGVRKLSDSPAYQVIVESSTNLDLVNGAFVLAPNVGTYEMFSKGTVRASSSASGYAAPITNVLAVSNDISGDRVTVRVNGTQASQSTADQGTGNYLAYPLYIGRRGGTSLPFNGNIFSLIVRFGANLGANTITNTETWVNSKTGAY